MRLLIILAGSFLASTAAAVLSKGSEAHFGKDAENDVLVINEMRKLSNNDARAITEVLRRPNPNYLKMAKKILRDNVQADAVARYLSADKRSKTIISRLVSGKPIVLPKVNRNGPGVACQRKSELAQMIPEVESFKNPIFYSRYIVDFVLEPVMKVRKMSAQDMGRTCSQGCKNSVGAPTRSHVSFPKVTVRLPSTTRLPSAVTTRLPSVVTTRLPITMTTKLSSTVTTSLPTTKTTTKPPISKPGPKKCGHEISSDESDESDEFKAIQNLTPPPKAIWNPKPIPTPADKNFDFDSSEESFEEHKKEISKWNSSKRTSKDLVVEKV